MRSTRRASTALVVGALALRTVVATEAAAAGRAGGPASTTVAIPAASRRMGNCMRSGLPELPDVLNAPDARKIVTEGISRKPRYGVRSVTDRPIYPAVQTVSHWRTAART